MRKIFAAFFMLFLFSPAVFSQLEVEEALFYPDRVTVIEKGLILLTQGRNILGFLPAKADRKHINVALNCDKATLIGIDLGDSKESEEYKKTEKDLKSIKKKIDALKREKEFYQQLTDTISQPDFVSKQGIQAVMKDYKTLASTISTIDRTLSLLNQQALQLKKKLEQLQSEKILYAIVDGSDQCEVAVSYTIPEGRWEPLYELSYSNNTVKLSLRAKAVQFTHKDWKDVSVSFSSSRPISYLVIPQPQPLFLYIIRRPERILSFKAKALSEKSLPAASSVTAVRTESIFYYKLETPITLKSREEKLLLLESWRWRTKPERIAVPTSSPHVYVKARVLRPKEPLINGPVEIVSGNFVIGTSYLSKLEKGKYFEFPLGIDEEVEVKRELVDKKIDEKWGGDIEIYAKYRITLFNNRDSTVEVKLFEPLPVSKDEPIKVRILEDSFTIKPDKISATGIAFWKLSLKPKEKKVVEYAFKVRYPKDKKLNIHF
ncbi:MAG: DUF4139 domain-containing protein [Deferribacteres bacterium]|nr:DUF4139 domain-containing protein [Deferribacteres bacterium]